MAHKYDVIIIGGGPGGYSSAINAAKKGAQVALFEGGSLGGTCLNVGCVPTKYLLDKASAMERIRKLTNQGVFKDAGLFSFKKIQQGKAKVVEQLTTGVKQLLKDNGVTVVKGFAELKKDLVVECYGRQYTAKDVIIATGSEPMTLPIPGAEYAIDSTEALCLKKVPSNLVVVGGGVIGMELASAYASFGSNITVVEMLEELFPEEESSLIRKMTWVLKKRGISIVTGAKVKEIKKSENGFALFYSKNGNNTKLSADAVLAAIGRKPNLKGIDTTTLGIELNEKGEIAVDDRMQTSVKHVYAIGDAVGGFQLAHAAYAEGECAVHNILEGKTKADFSAMPRCIYTTPHFAAVGHTSMKAREAGHDVAVGSFEYIGNGMAVAEGAEGMVIVVSDKKTTETLGIHILGKDAVEMIAFATAAVAHKMTLEKWKNLIVAHPSLCEMIREAALDCFEEAVHKMTRKD